MKKALLILSLFFSFNLFVFQPSNVLADNNYNLNSGIADNTLEDYLCNALMFLTGGVGKSLAAFGCIGISLVFVSGKVAWTTVLAFALGMGCIFGAPQIVKAFAGGNLACDGKTGIND